MKDLFNHVLDSNALENSFHSFKRAAPLHASLIFRCCDDDAMWINFACREGDERWRDITEAVKRSKRAARVREFGGPIEV